MFRDIQKATMLFRKFFKGMISNIFLKIYIDIINWHTIGYMRKCMAGRSVVIVGNNPSLLDRKLGLCIDEFDFVVRVNLTNQSDSPVDFGEKCNLRFIGSTLNKNHVHGVKRLGLEPLIVTKIKNRKFMKRHGISRVLYISDFTPRLTLALLSRICRTYQPDTYDQPPPRSGLVMCQLILCRVNPERLALVGFTTDEADAMQSINFERITAVQYDAKVYTQNHCDVSEEVRVLTELASSNLVELIR